ncbi:MAG: xylulokinase, partial [Clostridia bacterium]|nr:xylulokinase [Clostridia bacterium]
MNCYIGADLGTSALKLLLLDEMGTVLKSVSKTYDVYYPNPGWSEQAPEDWWDAFVCGIHELVSETDTKAIRGIGVAGQMHGLVILDKNDAVIRPAILWNDGRTAEETAYLNEVIGKEKISEYTANIAFAGFTAPKLLWLKNHERENFDKIEKIMLPKDYINYRLTGVHGTDYSDASGFLLLDVKNKCWSEEMLAICGVQKTQMPKLFESYEPIGTLVSEVAELLDLSEDMTVVAGCGDNAGAAIGTGTIGEGKCNISLGTSGTIFISSDKFSVDKNNALHSFCHADGGYHLMGCMLSAASCNKWFCEEILNTKDYAAEQKNITEERLGNNHVFFLPYLMGERSPINDTDARGMFIGMRPDTTRADMVQAVLEGVAFAVRDSFEIAKKLGINIKKSTICGGGAKS